VNIMRFCRSFQKSAIATSMSQVPISFKCSHSSWRSSSITTLLKTSPLVSTFSTAYWTQVLRVGRPHRQIHGLFTQLTTDRRHRTNSKWSRLWWYRRRISIMNYRRTSRCRFSLSIKDLPGVNLRQPPRETGNTQLILRTPFLNSSWPRKTILSTWWWVRAIRPTGGAFPAPKWNPW
jgi:hypothetical protein